MSLDGLDNVLSSFNKNSISGRQFLNSKEKASLQYYVYCTFFIKFWFKSEHDLKTMDKGIVPRGIRLAARTIGRKAGAGGLVVIDAALRVLPALHAYKVRHKAGHIALEEGIVAQDNVLLTAAGFIQLGSHYKEGLRVRREVVSPTDTPP